MAINLPRPPNKQKRDKTTNRNTYWQTKKGRDKRKRPDLNVSCAREICHLACEKPPLQKPRRGGWKQEKKEEETSA